MAVLLSNSSRQFMQNAGIDPNRYEHNARATLSDQNQYFYCTRAGEPASRRSHRYFGTPIYNKQVWQPHARANSLLSTDSGSYAVHRQIGAPLPGYTGRYPMKNFNNNSLSPIGHTYGAWSKHAAHNTLMERNHRQMRADLYNTAHFPVLDERRRHWSIEQSRKNVSMQSMPRVHQTPGGVVQTQANEIVPSSMLSPRQLYLQQFSQQCREQRYAWQNENLDSGNSYFHNVPAPLQPPTVLNNSVDRNIVMQQQQQLRGALATPTTTTPTTESSNSAHYSDNYNNTLLYVPPHIAGYKAHAMRPLGHATGQSGSIR